MRRILACLVLQLFLSAALHASGDSLGVKIIEGKKYVRHKVGKGEGLLAIGRHYKVDIKKIEAANPTIKENLNAGDIILIPVESVAIAKPKSNPAPKSELTTVKKPMYYSVAGSETLFHIAAKHKTTVDNLKKWNKLKDNSVAKGQKLIVGYKDEKTVKAVVVKDKSKKTDPIDKDDDFIDPRYLKPAEETDEPSNIAIKETRAVAEKGIAGWIDDGSVITNKSLALHKSAPIGTIIKVTNLMNGKTCHVKVAGRLPENGENVSLKVTKTVADKLGVLDKFFRVDLSYSVEVEK